jgi:hypothetical protein
MGVLVKVENGAKKFWEKKFHAANGKAQPTLKVSCFFLLSFGGRRGGKRKIFFIFPLFQQVPNLFSWVFF